jgi:hypothetical protein
MKKAKVALARKLSVVLHRMIRDGEEFSATGNAVAPAAAVAGQQVGGVVASAGTWIGATERDGSITAGSSASWTTAVGTTGLAARGSGDGAA